MLCHTLLLRWELYGLISVFCQVLWLVYVLRELFKYLESIGLEKKTLFNVFSLVYIFEICLSVDRMFSFIVWTTTSLKRSQCKIISQPLDFK